MERKTVRNLVTEYGSLGKAAGAVALGIEPVDADVFIDWPEYFRDLIAYKQNTAILRLVSVAAGTSLSRLQQQWKDRDEEYT